MAAIDKISDKELRNLDYTIIDWLVHRKKQTTTYEECELILRDIKGQISDGCQFIYIK